MLAGKEFSFVAVRPSYIELCSSSGVLTVVKLMGEYRAADHVAGGAVVRTKHGEQKIQTQSTSLWKLCVAQRQSPEGTRISGKSGVYANP